MSPEATVGRTLGRSGVRHGALAAAAGSTDDRGHQRALGRHGCRGRHDRPGPGRTRRALGLHRLAAADDAAREVGGPDVAVDLDVAADPGAARHDRPLADDRDPGVQPARLLLVRAVVVRRLRRRSRPGPTTTSLSRIARSTTAPERMTESNMTIESRTTAPTSTRTPGDSTELTTVPSITQPWLIRLRWTCAVGPTLAGARSSDRVWMTQSRVVQVEVRARPRAAPCWPPRSDWIVPTSCQ